MARVAPVSSVAERDRARLRRIDRDLELAGEAVHQQALESRLARVAELGLARGQLAARGVLAVDELEEVRGARLDAAGEDVVGIDRSGLGLRHGGEF